MPKSENRWWERVSEDLSAATVGGQGFPDHGLVKIGSRGIRERRSSVE